MISSKALLPVLVLLACFGSSYSRADSTDGSTNPYTGNDTQYDTENVMPTDGFDVQYGNANFQDHINHTDPLIRFSYQESSLRQRVLSNQIFEATGIYIDGVKYGWKYQMGCNNSIGGYCSNPNGPNDWLEFDVTIEGEDGDTIYESNYFYEGYYPSWQSEDVVTYAPQSYSLGDELYSAQIDITGKDTGYWAGNYGPIVTDVYMNFIYRYDTCPSDPLSSTSCDGYAEAYAEQEYNNNCSANPLYDSGCPGYSTAYHNQQCNANPLYDTSCPGYQQAYFAQQCNQDPLYSEQCPGYETAFYNQQCSVDPLYDSGCPGYETAYFDQQCSADPLYDSGCPGYESAYHDQQCTADPLYKDTCPGYAEAYFEKFVKPELEKIEEEYEVVEEEEKKDDNVIDILDDTVVNAVVFDDIKIEVVELEIPEIEVVEVKIEEVEVEEPTFEEKIEQEIAPPKPEPKEEEELTLTLFVEEEEENEEESSDNVDEQVGTDGDEESDEPRESDDSETKPDSEGEDKPREPAPSEKRKKVKDLLAKKADELANDLANAVTLEQQQAIQNELFAIQSFNYEFKGYSLGTGYEEYILPDTDVNPSSANQRGLRNGLAQQLLHQQMVDMQWRN